MYFEGYTVANHGDTLMGLLPVRGKAAGHTSNSQMIYERQRSENLRKPLYLNILYDNWLRGVLSWTEW